MQWLLCCHVFLEGNQHTNSYSDGIFKWDLRPNDMEDQASAGLAKVCWWIHVVVLAGSYTFSQILWSRSSLTCFKFIGRICWDADTLAVFPHKCHGNNLGGAWLRPIGACYLLPPAPPSSSLLSLVYLHRAVHSAHSGTLCLSFPAPEGEKSLCCLDFFPAPLISWNKSDWRHKMWTSNGETTEQTVSPSCTTAESMHQQCTCLFSLSSTSSACL